MFCWCFQICSLEHLEELLHANQTLKLVDMRHLVSSDGSLRGAKIAGKTINSRSFRSRWRSHWRRTCSNVILQFYTLFYCWVSLPECVFVVWIILESSHFPRFSQALGGYRKGLCSPHPFLTSGLHCRRWTLGREVSQHGHGQDRNLFRPRAVLEKHPKLKTWVAVAELVSWIKHTKF